MMATLIDADELKLELKWLEIDKPVYHDVMSTIDEMPTVDPVKHGHWDNKIIDARFDVPHTVARCSNCKGKIWVYEENYVVKYPYCPLCGCKMDEVTE